MPARFIRSLFLVISLSLSLSAALAQVSSGVQVTFSVDQPADQYTAADLHTAAQIITRRLDALELEAALVQIINGAAIQVQFSGVADPQAVIDTLAQTALLELVDFSDLGAKADALVGGAIITTSGDPTRAGRVNPLTGRPFETVLTGADFQAVDIAPVPYDTAEEIWQINFELTDEAGQIFGDFTEAHLDQPIAIVLDGQVISAPILMSRMEDAGVINGNYSKEDAERLAAQLRAGALPLPLKVESVSTFETVSE